MWVRVTLEGAVPKRVHRDPSRRGLWGADPWDRPNGQNKGCGVVGFTGGASARAVSARAASARGALESGWGRLEAFLRIDGALSTAERLRAWVICGVAATFVLVQAVNWFTMYVSFGGWSRQHAVSGLACLAMVGIALSLRWTRSPRVAGVAYGVTVLVGVFAASATSDVPLALGGINTALLPMLVSGSVLLALTSDWKSVVMFALAATAMMVGMAAQSEAILRAAAPALSAIAGAAVAGAGVAGAGVAETGTGAFDLVSGLEAAQGQAFVQALVALWVVTLIMAPFGATFFATFHKLEAAVADAERANRAKSDFLATMSHEVRTPLNGIIAMSDLMVRQGLDGAAGQQAAIINTASAQLLHIVNGVLDSARLEAGEVRLRADAFDLREAVGAVVELHRARAEDKGVWLGLEWQEGLPARIVGDVERWKQIVGNFVGNAVKFTKAGGVRVGVRGVAAGENALRLQVFVQDTGPGIEAAAQSRIFERYAQSESGARQGAGGTGLGLAITRELVELMGGRVSLRSKPGCGSVFAVEMVVELAAPKSAAPKAKPQAERSAGLTAAA